MQLRTILVMLSLAVQVGCAAPPVAPSSPMQVASGRRIAQARCARCHAIDLSDRSPNAEAPPFRNIIWRYMPNVLEQRLVEGHRVAQPMPDFTFGQGEAAALVAYLEALGTSKERPVR